MQQACDADSIAPVHGTGCLFTLMLQATKAGSNSKAAAPAAKGSAAQAAGKAATAGKPSPTSPGTADPAAAMQPEPVAGLDTPCHAATVLAYGSAVKQLEQQLQSAVQGCKAKLYEWHAQCAADQQRWDCYVRNITEAV